MTFKREMATDVAEQAHEFRTVQPGFPTCALCEAPQGDDRHSEWEAAHLAGVERAALGQQGFSREIGS